MRATVFVLMLLLSACARNEPVAEPIPTAIGDVKSDEALRQYALKGEVARLDVEHKIATIKHQAIGDWMGPMTMDFPVKDGGDFAKLKEGQSVDATVNVQGLNYWVSGVK